jgi:hypothetical protein
MKTETTEIKTMADLIKDLSKAYDSLRDKKLDLNEAKEISNIAGKLIKGSSVQLKYNQYMKIVDEIPFLKSNKD